MNAVHFIKERRGNVIVTHCGKIGFKTRWRGEYDTAEGRRFDAVKRRDQCDCLSCRRNTSATPESSGG